MNKIGVIGAMHEEVELLRARMRDGVSSVFAGREFTEGMIGNARVVLVQCGIGKVNAAVCTEVLVNQFHVTHILNTGIAGSLNDEIDIGDAVVSTDAIQHDMDAVFFGYQPGEVPQLGTVSFPADPEFQKVVTEAVKHAAPDIHVFSGRVVSGDCFVSSDEKKQWIKDTFGGMCVEMEGAAIAQTAWINQIPFVIVRFISDKANHEAEKSYAEIETDAAQHSARITSDVLERLSTEE